MLNFGEARRANAGAWGDLNSGTPNFPPITNVPFYVRVRHVLATPSYAYRWETSYDGGYWTDPYPQIAQSLTAESVCETAYCASVSLKYVGIVMERMSNSSTGMLTEITEFTVETD